MKYCKKCKKEINSNNTGYYGLCENCYREYLIEKINNLGKESPKKKSNFLSTLFKKRKNKN